MMRLLKLRSFSIILALASGLASYGNPLIWPASQYFPAFSTPAGTIDCVDMDGLPSDQIAMSCSLEGIVNRAQPRLACVSGASEGAGTWMRIHNLSTNMIDPFSAVSKYETNVTGLVVYDANLWDTLNLATTIAGVKNELICDGALLPTLTNSPYNLVLKDDLRGMFSTKYQVYGYLYTNYWTQCNHRIFGGLQTNNFWYLRDYLVAERCAVVWLDPTVSADASTLTPFISSMTPVDAIWVGYVPNESGDLEWLASYGIPIMASDLYDNATVYGGVQTNISVQAIPPVPALQNKIYVSLTLSDGDNVQYMQHTMYQNWQSSSRGKVPIGWTVQPLLASFDPVMMNYFSRTATTNDCFVAGPSGAGYTRLNYWSAANVTDYTKASSPYLQQDGIRMITVWLNVSASMANTYATNCPTLLGINDQSDGYLTTSYKGLPDIGFPSTGNYAETDSNLLNAITNTGATWSGSSPMFIAAQGSAWDIAPADCQTIASELPTNYVVVRPDHLFLLYRQAAGLGAAGAFPYVAQQPASQFPVVGSKVTFNVIASGTGPLGYQWEMNGTNIPGATASSYTNLNVQLANAGNYQIVVTNSFGSVTSSVAVITFGTQPLGFNGNGLNWSANQSAGFTVYSTSTFVNNVLTLTDGNGNEAQSVFFNSPQYIGAFDAAFTYQAGGNKAADGASFCIQNDPRGLSALGGGGGGLGVSGITPSLELELNLYSGNSQSVGYTVLTNGLTGAGGANGNYYLPGSVNLASGDPINITVNYANGVMALTFTDTVANTSFSTEITVGDLTHLLDTNTAYVGFTGADGGSTAVQTIGNFSFSSFTTPALVSQIPPPYTTLNLYSGETPSFSVAATGYPPPYYQWFSNNVAVASTTNNAFTPASLPASGITSFYCMVTNIAGSTNSATWLTEVVATPTAAYPQAVLAFNPIAYWPLNEAEQGGGDNGVIAYDYVGGNNGVYSNVVLGQLSYNPIADPTETAALFGSFAPTNSEAGQIYGPDFSTPAGNNAEYSISAWVNGSAYTQTRGAGIVTKGNYQADEELSLNERGGGRRFSV